MVICQMAQWQWTALFKCDLCPCLQLCTLSYMTCCRRRHISVSTRTRRSSSHWTRCVPTSGNRCVKIRRCTAARMLSSSTEPSLCFCSRNHSTAASLITSDLSLTPSDNFSYSCYVGSQSTSCDTGYRLNVSLSLSVGSVDGLQ